MKVRLKLKKPSKKILVGVTASIAAYKACEVISEFKDKGYSVRCAMTKDAANFITPLTLETLTGHEVSFDMFRLSDRETIQHTYLGEESDLIVVVPATCDIIGKIASGMCNDVLTCSIFASKCPVLFVPAMNDLMFANPIVKDKISYLERSGYHFVYPVIGKLACGREGMGHIAPIEKIVKESEKLLS